MKNFPVKFGLLAFAVIFLFIFSQNSYSQDLTWNEIKLQQNTDRTSMENRQSSELNVLKELQKNEIEKMYPASNQYASDLDRLKNVYIEQKAERLELSKTHAEERTKLAQIHADERRNFLAVQQKK